MEFQDDPFSQPKAIIQQPFPSLSMPVQVFLRKLNNLSGQQLSQCIPDLQHCKTLLPGRIVYSWHHPAWHIGMTLLWLLADSNELKAFRSVSGDRWLYLAVIAIDLWPINSRTVNKSVPSATNHEANEWRHV